MKITLLAGNFENTSNTLFALEKVNQQLYIDWQLEKLMALNYEVDVVLGYRFSEEILRESLLIRQCHIIFDPNEAEGSPLSNLFAGLFALYGEGFFLPIQFKSPSLIDWQRMIKRLYQVANDGYHTLRPYCPIEGSMQPGYPLGITRQAKTLLMKDRKINKIEEAQLKEYKMPVLDSHMSQPYLGTGQNLPQVG